MKRTATKRRTKEQLNVDRIIKKELIILKDNILEVAVPRSRRRPTEKGGGRLQDEMNGRVAPDTTLTMFQMYYGQYNYPAGVTSGQKNALLITMQEMIPDTTKIIIGEINDILLQPFKTK